MPPQSVVSRRLALMDLLNPIANEPCPQFGQPSDAEQDVLDNSSHLSAAASNSVDTPAMFNGPEETSQELDLSPASQIAEMCDWLSKLDAATHFDD